MNYKLILKMAGISLGTVIIEQILMKAGKQTEATLISLISIAVLILMSISTVNDVSNSIKDIFTWGD